MMTLEKRDIVGAVREPPLRDEGTWYRRKRVAARATPTEMAVCGFFIQIDDLIFRLYIFSHDRTSFSVAIEISKEL